MYINKEERKYLHPPTLFEKIKQKEAEETNKINETTKRKT
jgi:hypothetical protein